MLILCAFSVAFHLTFQNGFAIISNEWNKGLFSAERIWKRIREGKRESGGNPERSGHCNRGAIFQKPLYICMRRGKRTLILEPGNLLGMARLNFRWKCNNQFWGIRSPEMLSAFVSGHFLWNDRLFRRIIQIKWQAILLRMKPFPPRIYERIIFYPGVASLPLK